MKIAGLNWKPFPAVKPEKSGQYFVTMGYPGEGIAKRYVYYDINYSKENGLFNSFDGITPDEHDTRFSKHVLAWAEQIEVEPYAG